MTCAYLMIRYYIVIRQHIILTLLKPILGLSKAFNYWHEGSSASMAPSESLSNKSEHVAYPRLFKTSFIC